MALPVPGAPGCAGNVLPLLIQPPGCRKGGGQVLAEALQGLSQDTGALSGHISGAWFVSVLLRAVQTGNRLAYVTSSERAKWLNLAKFSQFSVCALLAKEQAG